MLVLQRNEVLETARAWLDLVPICRKSSGWVNPWTESRLVVPGEKGNWRLVFEAMTVFQNEVVAVVVCNSN